MIAHKRYAGWPVHVVFLTDGGASHVGHPQLTAPEVIRLRRRETASALAELGLDPCAVHFLDEPDGTLAQITPERADLLTGRIRQLIESLQPREIFLPSRPDGSTEHDAAHALILQAHEQAALPATLWQYPIWSWWNPRLLLQQIVKAQTRVRLPLGDFTAAKHRAIACYASQTRPTPPWTEPVIPPALLATLHQDTEYFFLQSPRVTT